MPRFIRKPQHFLLALLSILLAACSQSSQVAQAPASPYQALPERELDQGEAQLARYVNLVNADQNRRVYQYYEGGKAGKEEIQWNLIQADTSSQLFFSGEVFNVYQSEEKGTEYYVLESAFSGENQASRWAVREVQFTASDAGLELGTLSEQELRVAETFSYDMPEGSYDLYRLEGFAHPNDPEPGHIKFWSPVYGTLLIWYGEDRRLELVRTGKSKDEAIIRQLLRRLKSEALPTLSKP